MRTCPVCNSDKRRTDWRTTFLVPDGWTQPAYLDWCQCQSCGMIYGDNPDITQRDYDTYYIERYGFGVDDEHARKRCKDRAEWAMANFSDKETLIVDFGGGVSGLTEHLQSNGWRNAHNIGPNQSLPSNKVDVLFAEHVLEHIYDLPAAMTTIARAVKDGGYLVVDGPAAEWFAVEKPHRMLDYHQKHINHFCFNDYIHLMYRYNFSYIGHTKYDETGPSYNMLFTKTNPLWVYTASMLHINKTTSEDIIKLRNLGDKPVIVWGCGDRCMSLLSEHMPNVQYFVDKDPAFIGACIAGKKVYDKVMGNDTILVIAQRQRQAILDNIRDEGLTNEVIVL